MPHLTRTEISWTDSSRTFDARHNGTCAASGLPFYGGEQIRSVDGGRYVSQRGLQKFGFCGGANDATAFRCYSNWQRVADPAAALQVAMRGDDLEVMNKHGVVTRFARRGDVFKPAAGLGTRSQKQVLALLRGAHAFCVRAAGA